MWINEDQINMEEHIGFVYQIENIQTGKKYIGKKSLISTRTKKLGVRAMAAQEGKKGRKKTKETVVRESDWQRYWGSDDELKQDVETLGKDNFVRTILRLCTSKKELSYYEEKFMFINEVLEDSDKWYNKNIGGTYFRRDVQKIKLCIEDKE